MPNLTCFGFVSFDRKHGSESRLLQCRERERERGVRDSLSLFGGFRKLSWINHSWIGHLGIYVMPIFSTIGQTLIEELNAAVAKGLKIKKDL